MVLGAHVWLAPDAVAPPCLRQVVSLSRREMAALRSSLPSPTKHKGRQMAEKMGIKTGEDLKRSGKEVSTFALPKRLVHWRCTVWTCTAFAQPLPGSCLAFLPPGPDSSITQIGNLEFRTEEEAGPSARERLRASWRYRAAGGQRLRLRGAAGRGGGSEEGGGAAE